MSFQGYKYEEIAKHLAIPLGTVKIRIHNARHKLQDSLANYGVDVVLVFGIIREYITVNHSTVVVDENVFHHGVEPSFEVGALSKFVFVPERL
ncbi:MAG: RNA polymerase sigma factor [Bacteroidota bacterium]